MTQKYSNQAIYKREEIPIVDLLMMYKDDLVKEFLAFHTDWEGELKGVIPVKYGFEQHTGRDISGILNDPNAWKAQWLRYEWEPNGKFAEHHEVFPHFPTAVQIMEDLKGELGNVTYSILEANSVIGRHTGPENRTGEYLRIHLPLIVPEGDIFLEVDGEEVTWEEPFGFNNQLVHSAHNHSPYRRLVFLIDIKRTRLGLPPGKPYDETAELKALPFVRNSKKSSQESAIYKSDEVPMLDELMEYQEDLIKDFLEFHTDWHNVKKPLDNVTVVRPGGNEGVTKILSHPEAWKASWLRYEWTPDGKFLNNTEMFKHFPTAVKIMEKLEGDIGHVTYSILEANSIIGRHTGPENRTGEYLRLHLPLIVPEGDIFLEVDGEEVTWAKPFGFNNQLIHSAYNHSPYRRLVFLIDVRRTRLGLSPGKPYNEKDEINAAPFIRKNKEI